jgi:L-iditol 2-dehydrogenase
MNLPQTLVDERAGRAQPADRMWAGVYRGVGRVEVEKVPVPAIADDEVLLRVEACGICGTDVKKIHKGFLKPPQILGHEIAGTIIAAGPAVQRWRCGQRIICFHHVPCRRCFFCERRLFSQCPQYKRVGVTAGFDPNGGGFSEYVRVMNWIVEHGLIEIPPDVSFEEGVFVEPVNTCWKAIHKARIESGETVVVLGQGPIGLLLLMLARQVGATVVTTDPIPTRRQKSLKLGAEASWDASDSELLLAKVRSRTEGRGADAVLVAAPHASLLQQALALTRPGGRVLLFAYNDPLIRVEFPGAAVGVEEKEILGSYSSSWDLQEQAAHFVFEQVLPVRELITHRLPLAEIGQALALAASPSADSLKVVLKP